jgi:hypothetical protein
MNSKLSAFAEGLGGGFMLFWILLSLFIIGVSIYGVYLAFCASILFGLIVLITPPSSTVIGLVYIGWGKNLAALVVQWLNS